MAINEWQPQAPLWIQRGDSAGWWRFDRPQQVVWCRRVEQVRALLRQAQQWADQGLYVVGFVSYEAAAAFDDSMQTVGGATLPLAWFAAFRQAEAAELPPPVELESELDWQADVTPAAYRQALAQIKQAIARGDTYQVNYTYRLQAAGDVDPWRLFLHLQQAQQGRYGAYIDLGSHVICSASPELFFKVAGNTIITRPMKGTAPRGSDAADDLRQRQRLLASDKDRAENLMIVDMLRNDLGRIAEPGSVTVEQLCHIEAYPTVWQLTTPVRATLQPQVGLEQQFAALFPCASITGAPKVKTMQLIRQLETTPRQIYTGTIGLLYPDGRSQFNVAIRTAVVERARQQVSYGVGGGIVWDSQADDEWRETRTKARVLPGLEPFRLLETLRWQPAVGYLRLEYHLSRLQRSAEQFGYPLERHALRRQLIDAAARRSPRLWRVRCLVAASGAVTIEFYPFDGALQRQALNLRLLPNTVVHDDPLLRHKTDRRRRYRQWRDLAPDADEVLLVNERGEVTEATVANVVAYLDGQWVTPPLACGLLPGTLRQQLLDQGRIVERVIRAEQLTAHTPLYLINSLRGWRWARLCQPEEA